MNRIPTSDREEPSQEGIQEEHPPIAETTSLRPTRNVGSTGGLDSTSRMDLRQKSPNWIMAVASILLVGVTGLYTEFARRQVLLTTDALEVTKGTLAESTKQFSATLQEMKEQTVAAQNAAATSEEAAVAANKSAEVAGQQVAAMKELTDVTSDAMRLDQRVWVGYSKYAIEARENDTSAWTNREPKAGEQFRVRFYIRNTGKTPAFNVRVTKIVPTMIRSGKTPDEPTDWSSTTVRAALFPDVEGVSQNTLGHTMSDELFFNYSKGQTEILFWARLYYCDYAGRGHWTQTGVAHAFGTKDFSIRSNSASPDPGEAGHPRCLN